MSDNLSYHASEQVINSAPDKGWGLRIIQKIFSYFTMKTYVVTSLYRRLDETVLMKGHKICFIRGVWAIIAKLSSLPLLIWSSGDQQRLRLGCSSMQYDINEYLVCSVWIA